MVGFFFPNTPFFFWESFTAAWSDIHATRYSGRSLANSWWWTNANVQDHAQVMRTHQCYLRAKKHMSVNKSLYYSSLPKIDDEERPPYSSHVHYVISPYSSSLSSKKTQKRTFLPQQIAECYHWQWHFFLWNLCPRPVAIPRELPYIYDASSAWCTIIFELHTITESHTVIEHHC